MCQELQEAALLPGLAWEWSGRQQVPWQALENLIDPGRTVSLDGSLGWWHLKQSWLMCGLKEFVTCAVLWEGLFDL